MFVNTETRIGQFSVHVYGDELMIAVRGPDGEKETEDGLHFIAKLAEVMQRDGVQFRTYKRHECQPEERTDTLFIKVLMSLVSPREDT